MRHNSVVSGHLKSTGIPRVDGLLMRPSNLGRHGFLLNIIVKLYLVILRILNCIIKISYDTWILGI